ncbi:MAG: response regulator transcription factor [Candidatus Omnitrophota bacterium]|jgi:DNA-binding response OmpR family regulator
MRILLVEDEKKMSSFIQRGLREEGYAVDPAYDGLQAWDLVSANDYDAVILDLMIPEMNGIDLCARIRAQGNKVPVLMLTARDSVEDKIRGLDQGADDYLTKPFAFDELLARLRALLRRPALLAGETQLACGDLQLDLLNRQCRIAGEEVTLSQKEFSLIEFLMKHRGEVVSRTQIAEHVWDLHFDPMSNTIDVYINFLRNKLDRGHKKSRIETIRGAGYRLLDA